MTAVAMRSDTGRVGEHPRLDWHLENWAEWMHSGGTTHLRCGTMRGSSGSEDFDDMVQAEDRRVAQAVDACISSLAPSEQCAVRRVHLGEVWRGNREALELVYERARLGLSSLLRRRAIW